MPLIENNDDRLDIKGLPAGLPDPIYATWLSALREIKDSPASSVGKERYQFCCGYVQALQDAARLSQLYAGFSIASSKNCGSTSSRD